MINILDDEHLYQWDSNRKVVLDDIDALATEVHFAQYCASNRALIVPVKTAPNGVKYAEIPNNFLCDGKDVCAWTWEKGRTINGRRFKVISRVKPADYAYTPTEVLNYEHLRQEILDIFQEFEVAVATDYETLKNKPKINSVELVGDKNWKELGLESASVEEIDALFAN